MRKDRQTLFFSLLNASARPMDTVDFPSPAGVGVRAVIKIKLPRFVFSSKFVNFGAEIFAL